jgi:hypothetical protein
MDKTEPTNETQNSGAAAIKQATPMRGLEIKKLVVAHIHNPVVVERVDLVHSNAIRCVVTDRFKSHREELCSKKQWKLGEIMNAGVDQCCLQT